METDLRIIERPALPPGKCIACFADEDPQGFIDTGITLPDIDPRVIVSVTWVKTTAKKLGLVEPDGDASHDEMYRELNLLREENAQLNKQLEAIDMLEGAGFTARKRRGRPPAKKEEE